MKTPDAVTEQNLKDYERVRAEGRHGSMLSLRSWTDSGLDLETYLTVLKHYRELSVRWPKVKRAYKDSQVPVVCHACGAEYRGRPDTPCLICCDDDIFVVSTFYDHVYIDDVAPDVVWIRKSREPLDGYCTVHMTRERVS